MWYIQQAEGAGAQSVGSIDFAGSSSVEAGTFPLYLSADYVGVTVTDGMTADELATKLDTINYEIVTCIAQRVPRIVVHNENDG